MKLFLKITCITILSLIVVMLLSVFIASYLLLSPSKLTPVVNKQLKNYVTADVHFDTITLGFFKSFPQVNIDMANTLILNKIQDSPDTLAFVKSIKCTFNIKEFIKNKNLIVDKIFLSDGRINLFTNCLNENNFDIITSSSQNKKSEPSSFFKELNLNKIKLENVDVCYQSCPNNIYFSVNNVNLSLNARAKSSDIFADISLLINTATFRSNYSFSTDKLVITAKGTLLNDNLLNISSAITLDNLSFSEENAQLTNFSKLSVTLPVSFDLSKKHLEYNRSKICFNDNDIMLSGFADINIDSLNTVYVLSDFQTNSWIIENVFELIPANYLDFLNGINITGNSQLSGTITGNYNASSFPEINVDVLWDNGTCTLDNLPYKFEKIKSNFNARLNLYDGFTYIADIKNLYAITEQSYFNVSGNIRSLPDDIAFDIVLSANLYLSNVKDLLPKNIFSEINGNAKLNLKAKLNLDDITKLNFDKAKISGTSDFHDLFVVYDSSYVIQTPELNLSLLLPSSPSRHFIDANITSQELQVSIGDTIKSALQNFSLKTNLSNVFDSKTPLSLFAIATASQFNVIIDTINGSVKNLSASFDLLPDKNNKATYKVNYSNDNISANIGKAYHVQSGAITLNASSIYDKTQQNLLLKYNPNFSLDLASLDFDIADIPNPIKVINIKSDYYSDLFNIYQSEFQIGHSLFDLKGQMKNIKGYFQDSTLLQANFDFTSNYVDIFDLIDIIGRKAQKDPDTITTNKGDNPFMVPLGVDFRLNTLVKKAVVNDKTFESVGGQITIKDGNLILQEVGFTSNAAKMLLTAMYSSPRKNNLFAGLDFHLLDVDIEELINLIPVVDTLVPMLKSFQGKAEFHIAAETNLKSNYEIKFSTLRASSSISGKDLVLVDSKTFSQIAHMLKFSKKTKNVVDSLSVELTVFKDEIDIYPFLLSMDKYKAIIEGRHNLDMSFDYHISIIDCPLPIRLGLDVSGTFSDPKYHLISAKYTNLYNPPKRNVVENQTIRLQSIIREALKDNIKRH